LPYTLRPIGALFNLPPATPPASTAAPAKPAAPTAPVATKPVPSLAARFVENARKFIGQPYAWGGGHGVPMTQPGPVDASGLVQQAARMSGLKLDGNAAAQQLQGRPVSMKALQPGDLVFHGTPATHVGIYVGNNQVVAASKPGKPVGLTNLYYFDNARRVVGATPATPAPTEPTAGSTPKATVTVKPGDSLWTIAKTELGDGNRWQEIYALNPFTIQNPAKLIPGSVLKLPVADVTGGSAAPANPYFNDYDY
jgi:cell wall-associated NlpC family hydrolase